ncbi:MAG: hypothetical protein K2Y02_06150, partial [Burkholderiaceae bacterium]|nr:hypothetical protein [Burkholderiaceae bacterium]
AAERAAGVPGARHSFYNRRMLNRVRVALMWVLLFALPFQGYAAATMLGCGPTHHRMSSATAEVASAPAAAAAHIHQHDAADAFAEAGDHHLAGKVSKCSACAACCVGAALPAAALVFAAAAPAAAPAAQRSVGDVRFVTDGPDRPPRTRLV